MTSAGLEFSIHTLRDNPTSDYFLHDGVSPFHFMFKHGLPRNATPGFVAFIIIIIPSDLSHDRGCVLLCLRFGASTLLPM